MKTVVTFCIVAFFALTHHFCYGQTADEIVKRHIDAVGGKNVWRSITAIKLYGTISAQGIDIPITITKLQGKGFRLNMDFNGTKNYQILTTKAGWRYFPSFGQAQPEELKHEEVDGSQGELNIADELFSLNEKDGKITLVGTDTIDKRKCYQLSLVTSNQHNKVIYIDVESYYIVEVVEKVMASGKEETQIVKFKDFKTIAGGATIPMSIDEGNSLTLIKKIDINPVISEDMFDPKHPD
jgi:hypothetical protein